MEIKRTIVIAEDSATQAERLKFILEENNFIVFHGENGKEALELVIEKKPHIVVSDIMMPVMDGYELARSIKINPETNTIPVILLTTLTGLSDILKGLESGADNYIIKPFVESDIISKIDKSITKETQGITKYHNGSLQVTYGEYLYNIDTKSTKLANFLITSYETALQKNTSLEEMQNELKDLNESLEEKVKLRTSDLLKEVTERKQYQNALEISEKQYRFLYNNAPDSIIQINSEGKITNCNKSESEITGYTQDEIIGKRIPYFLDKESAKKFPERKEILEKEGYLETEVLIIRKDGTKIPVWRKLSAIYDDNGEFTGAIIHSRDITARKQVEKELAFQNTEYQSLNKEYLLQNEKLVKHMDVLNKAYNDLELALDQAKESDKLKSAFLHNISHEIRTPMNGIIGFTGLLSESELSDEELHLYVNLIQSSANRLLSTVTDIVDISLIEANQIKIHNTNMNVVEKIKNIYSSFKHEIESKGIEFLLDESSFNTETIINTDKEKVRGVLEKLVKNAIKFTSKGSISIGYSTNDKGVEFFVKDSGIGIPKDRQEAIFERFIQADIEDKDVYEGTGLGLSISKAFVEILNGKLWVVSEEGKGSEFYFTVPFNSTDNGRPSTKKKLTPSATEASLIKDLNILIAEDEQTNFDFLSAVLSGSCNKVYHAENGQEVIDNLNENPDINLILMDIKMPGINGYETTKKIREINKDIPIIAQTALASTNHLKKAIESGCDDYITKPIKKDRLFEVINKYVG